MVTSSNPGADMSSKSISSALSAVARLRIAFGHQSVGANILQGIEALQADDATTALRMVEASGDSGPTRAGIFHAKIGVNGDPLSKLSAFRSLVAATNPNIAMMKFCFLDVSDRLSAREMLDSYGQAMAEIRDGSPGLTIVHATIPLTDDGNWKERLVKRVKRRPTARRLNTERMRYNALLLERFRGKEPVFDIALVESTRLDGTRASVPSAQGETYFLAPEFTYDGGHLNATGSRIAAAHLLRLLADIS